LPDNTGLAQRARLRGGLSGFLPSWLPRTTERRPGGVHARAGNWLIMGHYNSIILNGDAGFVEGELHATMDGRIANGANGHSPDTCALVGDSSFSQLVGEMHREFPDYSVPACEEILDWLKDRGLLSNGSGTRRIFTEAQWQSKFIKILEYIFNHPTLPNIYAILYALNQPLLDDIVGNLNPTQFAGKLDVSREAINKPVLKVRKKFNLPPRANQRSDQARNRMKTARLKQLIP
jgi:hypothetical protein